MVYIILCPHNSSESIIIYCFLALSIVSFIFLRIGLSLRSKTIDNQFMWIMNSKVSSNGVLHRLKYACIDNRCR